MGLGSEPLRPQPYDRFEKACKLLSPFREGRMHRLLTALGVASRTIGWKRVGIAASLLIVAFAITTLIRTLKGVDTGVILTALTEISPIVSRSPRCA